MKPCKPQIGLGLTVLFGCVSLLSAQPVTLAPESTLVLSGDSTLHPFTSTATVLTLSAEAEVPPDSDWVKAILEKGALKKWTLTLPVKGLQSREPKLDKNMYKALNAEGHPDIIFTMSMYETAISSGSATYQVRATGTLTIAGTQQPVKLEMQAIPESSTLRVRGQYSLRMTDYGVKPPSLMMGAIKVRDPVTIHFELWLR